MAYDLCAQYDAKNFPKREGLFNINVSGLSVLLMQKEQTEQIGMAIKMAMGTPLQERTDIFELWQKLLSIWNLSDAYREPEKGQITPEELAAVQEQAKQDAESQFRARIGPGGAVPPEGMTPTRMGVA